MSNAPDIVILSNQPEKVANLAFLLQLSHHHPTQINDDIEAFNYLVQRQNNPEPVKLLIIIGADANQPLLHLLSELERRDAMLPIMLICDNGPLPLAAFSCPEHLRPLVKQCEPGQTHSYIRDLLKTFSDMDDIETKAS